MISLTFCLVSAIVVLSFALAVSIRYNVKFANIILNVEDAIEESLDVLDENFLQLQTLSEKDIFFDSPEVRQAVSTISSSKDAILYVANILASIDSNAIQDSDSQESE